MKTDYAADLNDAILDAIAAHPRQPVAKIAKRLRADVGTVRQRLAYLVNAHYVTLVRDRGREVYDQAGQ